MPPKKATLVQQRQQSPHHLERPPPSQNALFLRTHEKWAAVCHYIWLFDRAIGVPDYTVQALEDDIADSTFIILPKLMHKMLYTMTLDRRINSETWQIYLRKQHIKRDPSTNPLGTDEEPIEWTDISVQDKLDVLHRVTEWPFGNPTRIRQLMNDDDNFANWRAEPMGYDAKRNAYWFIGGERLWIQRSRVLPPRPKKALPSKKRKKAPPKAPADPPKQRGRPPKPRPPPVSPPPTESRGSSDGPRRSKRASVADSQNPAKRRRMLGTRMSSRLHGNEDESKDWQQIPDEWLDDGESSSSGGKGDDRPVNGKKSSVLNDDDSELTELSEAEMSDDNGKEDEKDAEGAAHSENEVKADEDAPQRPPGDEPNFVEWEQICTTLDDWHQVSERFSHSTSSYEKALYKRLSKEIIPWVVEVHKEREKVFILEVEEVVGRKRSSRLAVLDAEKERQKAAAEEKAEAEARMDRGRRFEARERLQMSDRERRELEREERRRERELEEIQEKEELEAKEKAEAKKAAEEAGQAYGPSGRPIRRTRTAVAPAQSSDSAAERESWELSCEICHKKGWNIDDGRVITACEKCGKWQHTECHDQADDQAGRPRRDWNAVDFLCKACHRRQGRNRTPATNGATTKPTAARAQPIQPTAPVVQPQQPIRPYIPQQPYTNGHYPVAAQPPPAYPPGTAPNGAANLAATTAAGLPYSTHPYASQYAAQYSATAPRPQYPPAHSYANGQHTAYPQGGPVQPAVAPSPYPPQAYTAYPSSQSYHPPQPTQYGAAQGSQYWAGHAYGYPPAAQPGPSVHSTYTAGYPSTSSTPAIPSQVDKSQYRYAQASTYDAAQMLAYQARSAAATPTLPMGVTAPVNGTNGYHPPPT